MLQGLEDEQLAERARESKLRERHDHGRVSADELERALQFGPRGGGVEHRDVRQRQDRDNGRKPSAEQVNPEHHLLAGNPVTRENLVLR